MSEPVSTDPTEGRRAGYVHALALGTVAAVGLGLGVAYGSWSRACAGGACPSIGVLEEYRPLQAAKVYAADGRLLSDFGLERRTVLSLEEISPYLRAAFVAVEDQRFYQHSGIDFRRVLGAFVEVVRALDYVQGFSTITMQLARNVFHEQLPRAKTIRRKVREIQVALELERTYSKDRILELYLNQIYLGHGWYGVETASQRYFGKSARELNVAESALLAAIANVPGRYDPISYPDRALLRRNLVINLMRDQGYLSELEAERWKAYPIKLSGRQVVSETAPYFVEWVRQQLDARFGPALYERGYRVYTTLDLELQVAAERALEDQLRRIENGEYGPYNHPTYEELLESGELAGGSGVTPYLQGALVTMDARTGHVLALVGGRDFFHSKFNRATQARRQPGSSFKPFVYSAAIRAGFPASHIIDDHPISLVQPGDTMPWEPQNFEYNFRGPMTLRRGLTLSRNLVAVRLGLQLGERAVVGEAVRFGISTRLPRVPSVSIGSATVIPIEMVSAYTAFATLGRRASPLGILRVEDEDGHIIWEPQVRIDSIMDPARMWIVTSMLRDVVNRGTGNFGVRQQGFTLPAGGKTGTTNDGVDGWFIGFTPELVTGVWLGLDQPQRIKTNAAGGVMAAPAWGRYMKEVYERRPPPDPWDRPESLIAREVDNITGYLATEWCPRSVRYFEWYIPGTEPVERCPVHDPFARGIVWRAIPHGDSSAHRHTE